MNRSLGWEPLYGGCHFSCTAAVFAFSTGTRIAGWSTVKPVHVFTHAALELSVLVQRDAPQPAGPGEWWPLDRIEEAGLPTLFAKAARLVRAS